MRAAAPAVIHDDAYLAHLVPDECVLRIDLDPPVVHACCSVTINASPVATDAPASSNPALMAARPAGGTCLSECEREQPLQAASRGAPVLPSKHEDDFAPESCSASHKRRDSGVTQAQRLRRAQPHAPDVPQTRHRLVLWCDGAAQSALRRMSARQ